MCIRDRHKAEEGMLPSERSIGGTVHIGAGESQAMALIAQAMDEVRRTYPAVDFAIHSGTTAELKDGLVRGFYDVMLECEMREHAKDVYKRQACTLAAGRRPSPWRPSRRTCPGSRGWARSSSRKA